MVYCSLFQIWSTPVGYEEIAQAGGFEPIKYAEIFWMFHINFMGVTNAIFIPGVSFIGQGSGASLYSLNSDWLKEHA